MKKILLLSCCVLLFSLMLISFLLFSFENFNSSDEEAEYIFIERSALVATVWSPPEFIGDIDYINERHRQWVHDITYFRNLVFRRHPRFVTHFSWFTGAIKEPRVADRELNAEIGTDFNEALIALTQEAPYLTDFEILIRLQMSIALLRDNHSSFESAFFNEYYPLYPFWFMWSGDNIYLTITHQNYEHVLNHRLVGINDTPVEEILEKIEALIPSENQYHIRISYAVSGYLNTPEILQALGISDETQTRYTFVNFQGAEMVVYPTVYLIDEGVWVTFPDDNIPLFQQEPDSDMWYVLLETGMLYVRISAFRDSRDNRDWVLLFARLQRAVDNYDVQTLVVDLRDNPGGFPTHTLMELIGNNVPEVYTFINEGSTSASLVTAAHLASLGAVTVGQPSAQGLVFYTGGEHELPYSGYRFRLSDQIIDLPARFNMYSPPDLVFRPDILIDYTIEDWMNNRDPFLEFVTN